MARQGWVIWREAHSEPDTAVLYVSSGSSFLTQWQVRNEMGVVTDTGSSDGGLSARRVITAGEHRVYRTRWQRDTLGTTHKVFSSALAFEVCNLMCIVGVEVCLR